MVEDGSLFYVSLPRRLILLEADGHSRSADDGDHCDGRCLRAPPVQGCQTFDVALFFRAESVDGDGGEDAGGEARGDLSLGRGGTWG